MTEAHNIDCLTAMRKMNDNEFNLAIVDPPYGLPKNNVFFGDKESRLKVKRSDTSKFHIWNNMVPTQEYFDQLCRVSKKQIIWGINYYVNLYDFEVSPGRIFWDKVKDKSTFGDGELASCPFHHTTRVFRFMWNGMCQGKNMKEGHIMQGNKKLNEPRIHPTQKPVALYTWILRNYAKEGDRILDTHLGSGSSRIAAHDMGFDFVGYEIDKEYFEAQELRYQNHIQQQKLFEPNEMN